MIRYLITIAVPLLAPMALYLLYSWHLQRKGGEAGGGAGGGVVAACGLPTVPSETAIDAMDSMDHGNGPMA